jgi:hypothetical protein
MKWIRLFRKPLDEISKERHHTKKNTKKNVRKKRVLDWPHPINSTQLALPARLNSWVTKSFCSTLLDPKSVLFVAGPVLEPGKM